MRQHFPVASFLGSRPPRRVPVPVRCYLLLGGYASQFGWLLAGFGLVFTWVFAFHADVREPFDFQGRLETAQGVVTRCEGDTTTGGRPGTPVWAYHYSFEFHQRVYTGKSYDLWHKAEVGQPVTVEFPQGRPARSRIVGMKRTEMPLWTGIHALLFPLIGLALAFHRIRIGRRVIRLLAGGEPILGEFVSQEECFGQVNRRPVYRFTFKFRDVMGQEQTVTARTSSPWLLNDDEREPVLYDPLRPGDATLLHHLSGSPTIDMDGKVACSWPIVGILTAVAPAATVLGHGIYLIGRLLR